MGRFCQPARTSWLDSWWGIYKGWGVGEGVGVGEMKIPTLYKL